MFLCLVHFHADRLFAMRDDGQTVCEGITVIYYAIGVLLYAECAASIIFNGIQH